MTPVLADRVIALNGVTGHVGATQPRSFTTTARKRLQPSTLQPGLSAADRLLVLRVNGSRATSVPTPRRRS